MTTVILRCTAGLVGLLLLTGSPDVLASSPDDEVAGTSVDSTAPRGESREHEGWRKRLSLRAKGMPGCLRADFPDETWKSVPCVSAPLLPHVPRPAGAQAGGGSGDLAIGIPGRLLLTGAIGSFGTSGVSGETDVAQGGANTYSLQINTDTFTTPACNGRSGCYGWQQFVYSQRGNASSAFLFMQYWLIGYPSPCPSGYTYYPGGAGSASGCYKNSAAVAVPVQPLLNLSSLSVTGTANPGGLDQILLSTGSSMYSSWGYDSVLGLSANWRLAEFNIFGYCCVSSATFTSPTTLAVKTQVANGTTFTPTITANVSFTAETTNLSVVPPYCSYADPNGPFVWFQETFGGTTTATCPVSPTSLPAPTVTTTMTTTDNFESFRMTWPSVPNATYYLISRNGALSTTTGNASSVGLACQKSAIVKISSCNAAGCGWSVTVLNAKNTAPCL